MRGSVRQPQDGAVIGLNTYNHSSLASGERVKSFRDVPPIH
jgi:hypothetical protein